MGSGFEYGLLGPVEAAHGGPPVPIPSAKQRTLLASLLLEANRVVPAARLIARLWEDDLPADPRNALQNQVKRLRRTRSRRTAGHWHGGAASRWARSPPRRCAAVSGPRSPTRDHLLRARALYRQTGEPVFAETAARFAALDED